MKNILLNLGYNLQQAASCINPLTIDQNWHFKENINIPCVRLLDINARPSDGEVDSDGMVSLDSTQGFRLGRGVGEREYFDHTKSWLVGDKYINGSWYRHYDAPWNSSGLNNDNHGTIRDNAELALWIYQRLVSAAGPRPGPGPVSAWPRLQLQGERMISE
jgi:hypothetical protein